MVRRWVAVAAVVAVFVGACRGARDPQIAHDNESGPVDNQPPVDAGNPPVIDMHDGGFVLDGGTPLPDGGYSRTQAPNPIPAENALQGTKGWRDGRESTHGEVQVYASTESAEVGDVISVKVSTSPASSNVTAEVFRTGYYGGVGARRLWNQSGLSTINQGQCPRDSSTSLVECNWGETFHFKVGDGWVTGVYLIKVSRPDGFRAFYPFVVRDHRAAEVLYQPGFNTYQAYNLFQGEDLYADASHSMPAYKAFEVSYDRPYVSAFGSGMYLWYEYWIVRLMEQYGYDITYGSNLDFSRFNNYLNGIGAFVHGGHDEYWTAEERAQVQAAVESGQTSLAYFGANGGYWRTRVLPNSSGAPNRTLVCYKAAIDRDPIPNSTIRFRDSPNANPENGLFGIQYDGWLTTYYPLIVKDPTHWLFAGTGVAAGDRFFGIVGNEIDNIQQNGFSPSGMNVIAESPLITAEGIPDVQHTVERTLPNGRLIFAAGAIMWGAGLNQLEYTYDPRMERMTLNVLERALSHRHTPRTFPPVTESHPTEPAPIGSWAHNVAPYAGSTAGYSDGPAASAQFSGPTGIAVNSMGQVFVADTGSNRIRMIDNDANHTVRTIAGTGDYGIVDGPGNQAMFRRPTAIVIGQHSELYIADSDNHTIRRIEYNPPTWTVSTYAGQPFQSGYVDGPAHQAMFNRPTAIAIDARDNLFIADTAGCYIRRLDAQTKMVSTLAGVGWMGYADAANGLNAQFNNPSAIAVTANGDLFVIDGGNTNIRKVSGQGSHAVTTIAGGDMWSAGFRDGSGDQAQFRAQMGLALMPDGALIVGDSANHRLRKIVPGATASGSNVTTFVGTGFIGTATGAGNVANITAPAGLTLAPNGTLYVTDSYFGLIRAITP